ncbi:MAG TPA: precorrin-6y C5,15-methyltransferase (decarboxylating) subunit CbiE [Polyangiaceae bacterium]|nr:precorrin-6y C5,15-methyltransferase (decarboxylating) subunit CbiE [Polyangiaceae bacterium]
MSPRKAVSVIGLGDDGCASLSSRAAGAVARAQVLVGGERHLAFFPQFTGERIVLRAGLDAALERVAQLANEHTVCVLASGDPLFFGIGARVAKAVGGEHVEFLPTPTSVQWAFAQTGIAWDDAALLSLHGRPVTGFCAQLRAVRKAAVLTDADNSPARLAARLLEYGELDWEAWVCERLSGPEQRVRRFSLRELAEVCDVDPLNVLLLRRTDEAWRAPPTISYLPEEAFAKRTPKLGLITKREVRLLSLASLRIRPDSVVWDVGAGSGSVAVEAALLASRGKVFAIEVDPEGVAICAENARAHGVDHLQVISGRAPEALLGLDAPDAVFVGGSKGNMTPIVDAALAALRPGGRLVINAITLENVAEGYAALKANGAEPEVTLIQISRGAPLAHYQRYEALNPIHILAADKPVNRSEVPA